MDLKPEMLNQVDESPVFAFTVHRSGSTLLGRLLNSHPDLVVWGEHSGFVNNLAELDYIVKHNQGVTRSQSGDDAWLRKFVDDPVFRSTHLQPWTMPPHLAEARDYARNMMRTVFTKGLQPQQRWGFKEIRYHRPYIADYLLELFPNAKLVLLQRDIADAAVSNILSDWSQDGIKAGAQEETEEWANEVIRDVVYALLAFKRGFKWMKTQHPDQCMEVNYGALKRHEMGAAYDLLDFIGLPITPEVQINIDAAFEDSFNTTRKVPKVSKILTADYIRREAARIEPELQAEIDAHNVDRARLVSTVSPGKYSFLIGGNRSTYVRF